MIRIRPFTTEDVPLGMWLKQRAGWNQREADWRRFLDLEPTGCFLAEWAGQPAGTATACIFGAVAWIAMLLVDPAARGRGIGTALMKHALDFVDRAGIASVRLDATPLGRPIYEKLGFVAQFPLIRFDGTFPPLGKPVAGIEVVPTECFADVVRWDQEATGTDRRKLLERLFKENPDAIRMVRADGRLAGFLTARPGSHAMQIGPCLALAAAGEALMADTAYRYAGQRALMDIPTANQPAMAFAEQLGFIPTRELLRMCRGQPVLERADALWASSGPEKG